MNHKGLGPYLLSGLIIGPILGSGIIILPPIIYETAGSYALTAWILMMIISYFFAYLFGKLTLLYPGDSGVSQAVEEAFGKAFRHLAAHFLILAVCIGPIAVLGTASEYISLWTGQETMLWGLGLLLLCYGIVSLNVTSVGRISLFLSSFIACILVGGAVYSLIYYRKDVVVPTEFELPAMGYSLLLLFWSLVGWEIIGNYSGEVKDPRRTIPKALTISAGIITVVTLTVAAAFQWLDPSKLVGAPSGKLDMILYGLFGKFSVPLITLVTTALCISTALMVIGGISRLIAAQAEQGVFPSFLARRNYKKVPLAAMGALFLAQLITFFFVYLDLASITGLVALADGFFLGNVLLGILAAFRLFKGVWVRSVSLFLVLSFAIIFSFSSIWVILLVLLMTVYTFWRNRTSEVSII